MSAQEIIDLALLNGEGFEVADENGKDIVGIVMDPVLPSSTGHTQPFIIGVQWDDLAQDCVCL